MPAKPKPQTFLDFCDKLSPCLVRAMAMVAVGRKGRKRLLTHFEIAAKSGLPPRTVQRLASAKSWNNVKIGTASKFLEGCGVDIVKREGLENFITEFADQDMPHMDSKQKSYFYRQMGWVAP